MAESHLQVKLDASFEESKTKLLSKDRFEEYIKAIFGQSPWSLDYCEKLNSNKFKSFNVEQSLLPNLQCGNHYQGHE